jgi:hypothetical protein
LALPPAQDASAAARVGSAPVPGYLSKAVGAAAPRSDAGLLSTSLRESSRLRTPSARVGASGFTAWPGTPGTAAAGGALVGSAPVASGFSLFGSPTTATGRPAAKPAGLGVSKKPAQTKSQVRGAATRFAAPLPPPAAATYPWQHFVLQAASGPAPPRPALFWPAAQAPPLLSAVRQPRRAARPARPAVTPRAPRCRLCRQKGLQRRGLQRRR